MQDFQYFHIHPYRVVVGIVAIGAIAPIDLGKEVDQDSIIILSHVN